MPPKLITRTCEECGDFFQAWSAWIHRGEGRFCSRACAGYHRRHSRRPFAERFWEKVDKSGDCWVWTAALNHGGYGVFGHPIRLAHRILWELHYGPIPDGLFVCHHCDNRACVRPDHLFLGTQADNMHDMAAKGRSLEGERALSAKLAVDDVRVIRALARAGMSQSRISERFGVTQTNISSIIRRKTWRHVD